MTGSSRCDQRKAVSVAGPRAVFQPGGQSVQLRQRSPRLSQQVDV
jgi:hypothetical protein